jgi:hypothetical protein
VLGSIFNHPSLQNDWLFKGGTCLKRRNKSRFPADFTLELNRKEIRNISQFVMCSGIKHARSVFAFTEQGNGP